MLALADRSADWVEQASRDLEQAEQSMQAWGHTLTRLWAVPLPQEWRPAPPEGLEDRLRLLDSAQRTAAHRLVPIGW